MRTQKFIQSSIELLHRVQKRGPVNELLKEIAQIEEDELLAAISDDPSKKAFWLNLYNVFSSLAVQEKPKRLNSPFMKLLHFEARNFRVAKKRLSLNDIEHGFLRRSKCWWSKGSWSKPFPSAFEEVARVEELDPRIHFALNCGQASCPPIMPYHAESVEAELETATMDFLKQEMHEDGEDVWVTPLFYMYRKDFGGKKGILRFLEERGLIKDSIGKRLRFLPNNRTPEPGKFKTGAQ